MENRDHDETRSSSNADSRIGPGRSVKILMAVALGLFVISLVNSADIFERLFDIVRPEKHINLAEIRVESEKDRHTYADQGADEGKEVFVIAEVMPELIGGLRSIQNNIRYPEIAKRAGVEGKVFLQFVVTETGEIEDPVVTRGIGAGCDEAAVEALLKSRFIPGKQRGKAVRVKMSLPVTFRLR